MNGPSGKAAVASSREQLWSLLCEAAEIEHNLMCCYLYALFSLKSSVDEDVTSEELDAIKRWRGVVLSIAIEEMSHLAIVGNILSSLGAPAHFLRQNFPIPPGGLPADIVVRLAPFNLETLEHFIFLERPENIHIPDGAGFQPERRYVRDMGPNRLTPVAQDYSTVGQLYGAIEAGLNHLCETLGESAVFIGGADRQIGPEMVALPHLRIVRCRATACEAIEAIVSQGEGAANAGEKSHYQRFLSVREEYRRLLEKRPEFQPGRPAAHNPVMRRPPTPEGKLWVNAEPAASLLDLGNALYNHSLRLLGLAYSEAEESVRKTAAKVSVDLMRLTSLVGERLSQLPANAEAPGCTAGLSFATLRSLAALPMGEGIASVLAERIEEMAAQAERLGWKEESAAQLVEQLHGAAKKLLRLRPGQFSPVERPDPSPRPDETSTKAPVPEVRPDGIEVIEGRDIDLIFSAKSCIHARHCVLGQPKVFQANVVGPWINPDAASLEALLTLAHMCPSGAIRYRRKDGGPDEAAPPVNLLQLRENGPLGLRAEIEIDGVFVGMRATLCRCGASANKPYCDGSHNVIAFQATGEPPTRESAPLAIRGGVLGIEPEWNGPLQVDGNLEICAGTGRTVDRVVSARLCRCGGSSNKPFCDNTHRVNGFKS
jgi:CDGSH-type Zn-finger protein/uncharacterized Fe-S cluster protein YjdI